MGSSICGTAALRPARAQVGQARLVLQLLVLLAYAQCRASGTAATWWKNGEVPCTSLYDGAQLLRRLRFSAICFALRRGCSALAMSTRWNARDCQRQPPKVASHSRSPIEVHSRRWVVLLVQWTADRSDKQFVDRAASARAMNVHGSCWSMASTTTGEEIGRRKLSGSGGSACLSVSWSSTKADRWKPLTVEGAARVIAVQLAFIAVS
jgi:hypothetical protein